MITAIEVTSSVYKVSQNQQNKSVEFYRFNQLIKTEQADRLYQQSELFDILCSFAFEYNVQEELTDA